MHVRKRRGREGERGKERGGERGREGRGGREGERGGEGERGERGERGKERGREEGGEVYLTQANFFIVCIALWTRVSRSAVSSPLLFRKTPFNLKICV